MSAVDYLRLVVIEYIPPALMALLVGFVFAGGTFNNLPSLLLILISTALVVFGYNTFNAVYDKKIDIINKPYRPLPKGTITEKHALYLSIFFFVFSMLLSLLVNLVSFFIICIAIIFAIAYSVPPLHLKRYFLVGNFMGNVMYAVLFPLAGWSLVINGQIPWQAISILFLFGMGTAIMKDFEDVLGDSLYKVHTIPSSLGNEHGSVLSGLFIFASFLLLSIFISEGQLGPKYALLSVFIIASLANLYLVFKNHVRHKQRQIFINGMIILTLMEVCLVLLRLV